jgi:hypothetical protein
MIALLRRAPHLAIAIGLLHLLRPSLVEAQSGNTVAGRIVRADGTGVEGALVQVLRPSEPGEPPPAIVAAGLTDATGAFRISPVPAGDYFLAASRGGPLGAVTFYPGVLDPAQARRVRVEAAQATDHLDFELLTAPPLIVSGLIVTHDRKPLRSAAVTLARQQESGVPYVPSLAARMFPNGAFFFTNVTPGRYLLRASGRSSSSDESMHASQAIVVAGASLDRVLLTLRPAATITGEVHFDLAGTRPPDPSAIVVALHRREGGPPVAEAPVSADGGFAFRGVEPGTYVILAREAPWPWTLETVDVNGRDMTEGFELGGSSRTAAAALLFSDRATEIAGVVSDRDGRPAADRVVVVFPTEPGLRAAGARRIRVARTDAGGRYRVRSLPPGEYSIAAVEQIAADDERDPAFLGRLEPGAARVSVGPGAAPQQDLRLRDPIPPSPPEPRRTTPAPTSPPRKPPRG